MGDSVIELAKKLLKEAGYSGQKVVVINPTDFAVIHPLGVVTAGPGVLVAVVVLLAAAFCAEADLPLSHEVIMRSSAADKERDRERDKERSFMWTAVGWVGARAGRCGRGWAGAQLGCGGFLHHVSCIHSRGSRW